MIDKAERSAEQAVWLVDRAIRRKELLQQRRLAALNDVAKNEWGENLDDQQQPWRPKPVKGGMCKTFAESVSGLVERQQEIDQIDHENGLSNVEAVRKTEKDISQLKLTEAHREAGEFMYRRQMRAEKLRKAIAADEEHVARDFMQTEAESIVPELDMCQGAPVRCTAFSYEGTLLATGDQSGVIRLWARSSKVGGRPWRGFQQLSGHSGPVTALAFVPAGDLTDQPHLLSASGDCTVRRWAPNAAGEKWRLQEQLPVEKSSWVLDLCYVSGAEAREFGVDSAMLVIARGDSSLWCLVPSTAQRAPPGSEGAAGREGERSQQKSVAASEGDGEGSGIAPATDDGAGDDGVSEETEGAAQAREAVQRSVRWEKIVKMEQAHTDAVICCTRSPLPLDGHLLVVSVSVDWTVKLWRQEKLGDPGAWVCECSIMDATSGGRTRGAADVFPHDPAVLASAYRDRVLLFRLKVGTDEDVIVGHTQLATLEGHLGEVACVAFRCDGRLLASCDANGEVKLWHKAEGAAHTEWQCVVTCHAGQRQARGLCFGRGTAGASLVVCNEKGRVRLWDTSGVMPLGPLPSACDTAKQQHAEPSRAVQAEAEPVSISPVHGAVGPTYHPVLAIAMLPADDLVVGAGYGGGFGVWSVEKGTMQRQLPHKADVTCLTVIQTEDAEQQVTNLVVCGAADGSVKVTPLEPADRPKQSTARLLSKRVHAQDRGAVVSLTASQGGERVLAVWAHGKLVLWETKGWKEVLALMHPSPLSAAALLFLPSASYVAIAGSGKREAGTVVRFNARVGSQAGQPLKLHASTITALCFHPQGQLLASVGKEEEVIRITSLDSGEVERDLGGHSGAITALAAVASGAGRSASRKGARGSKDKGEGSKEEATLVSGGADCTVRVWMWAGEPLAVLRGHADVVWCVAGAMVEGQVKVASGSGDGRVRVWDAGDGVCRKVLVGEGGFVLQVRGRIERIKVEVGFTDEARAAQKSEAPQPQQNDTAGDKEEEESAGSQAGSGTGGAGEGGSAVQERAGVAEVERTQAYLEAVRLAELLHGLEVAPPEQALEEAKARREIQVKAKQFEESLKLRNMTSYERKRRERTRKINPEPPEPPTVEESTERRRQAAVWMCGKLLAAVAGSDLEVHPASVEALLHHRRSFDPMIRACATVSLCFVGTRADASAPDPEVDGPDADEELGRARAEVAEKEDLLLDLTDAVEDVDDKLGRWRAEYEAECRKAAKDKRRGRDMRMELDRKNVAVTRKHALERQRLVAAQLGAMQAMAAPTQRLAALQARWVVQELLEGTRDKAAVVREGVACALTLLSTRGDSRVAAAVSALVGDPALRVRQAAVLCLGEVALLSHTATANLVSLLGREHPAEVRMSALEGMAVVLRHGQVALSRHQQTLIQAIPLLKDEDARVRERALLVGSWLQQGERAGLPFFHLDGPHLDHLPPFAPSPYVPYPDPHPEDELRGRQLDPKRRGVFPHLEPPACTIPPNRSFNTRKQLDWTSESGRLYMSSSINPSVQLPGVASSVSRGEPKPDPSDPGPMLLCEGRLAR